MKRTNVKKTNVSKETIKSAEVRKSRGGEKRRRDCYSKCIDDAWDLKSESVCSSVCGF